MAYGDIQQGVTGKEGVAYYSAAARIMNDAAGKQSQVLAAQSAFAMQSIGALTTSISDGLNKYLQYKLSIEQAGFERDLRLKAFELEKEDMQMKRVQADSMLEDRKLARKKGEMDLAQREQDALNVPWTRAATASAMGVVSMAHAANARMVQGNPREGDAALIEGASEELGGYASQAVSRGASPELFEKLRAELVPLVANAVVIPLEDGTTMTSRMALGLSLRPGSPGGERLFSDASRNARIMNDPVLGPRAEIYSTIMADPSLTSTADTSLAVAESRLVSTLGLRDPAAIEVAKEMLSSMRGLDRGSQSTRTWNHFEKNGTATQKERMAQASRDMPGSPLEARLSAAGITPRRTSSKGVLGAATTWQQGPNDISFRPTSLETSVSRRTDRRVHPDTVAAALLEGISYDQSTTVYGAPVARFFNVPEAGAVDLQAGNFTASVVKTLSEQADRGSWSEFRGTLAYFKEVRDKVIARSGGSEAPSFHLSDYWKTLQAINGASGVSKTSYLMFNDVINGIEPDVLGLQATGAPVAPAASAPILGASVP
jgi:hypothetical protein